MTTAQSLQKGHATLSRMVRTVDRITQDHLAEPAFALLASDSYAARATPKQRIVHSAQLAAGVGAHVGGAAPGIALAALGTGHPDLMRDPCPNVRQLGYGLLGQPGRLLDNAYGRRADKTDGVACLLLGASLTVRALLFLPRMACRLAIAVGAAAGALAGALLGGAGQALVELVRTLVQAYQRHRAGADAGISAIPSPVPAAASPASGPEDAATPPGGAAESPAPGDAQTSAASPRGDGGSLGGNEHAAEDQRLSAASRRSRVLRHQGVSGSESARR